MSDIEELKARLLVIHDHDGNDLSPNDKRGLKDACAELDKLKRYEEREPLVQELIAAVIDVHGEGDMPAGENCRLCSATLGVRDFKLE